MPQGNEEAGEVEEALKDGEDAIIADLNSAEVLQPCVGAFDFPSPAVAAQLAFVFKASMTIVAAVRSDQFCTAPLQSLRSGSES
jgi:hypothetical protein